MTDDERKSLAEQLQANPLFEEMLSSIEADAIEALVHSKDEETRIEMQYRVRSTRALRTDCEDFLRNNQVRKGAVA